MRRLTLMLVVGALVALVAAPATLAGSLTDQGRKEAAGWGCGEAVGLPPGHCISPGTVANFGKIAAGGRTFQLQVFDESGNFATAEIATFKTSADGRPCPNDPESDDGTYWDFVPGVLYVCHHQPE